MSTEGRFGIERTPLDGLVVVERRILGDERGFLSRFFCADELAAAGFTDPVVQINHTSTHRAGTIRGLHFQRPPHAEDKFVSVLRGEVFDVALDLRPGSATFGRWYGTRLSAANRRSLFIPKGFAHGFQTLVDDCELIYLHTHPYTPAADAGVSALDPALGIDWPLAVTEMSARDRHHPPLGDIFDGLDA